MADFLFWLIIIGALIAGAFKGWVLWMIIEHVFFHECKCDNHQRKGRK